MPKHLQVQPAPPHRPTQLGGSAPLSSQLAYNKGVTDTQLLVGGILATGIASFFLAVFLLQAGEGRARRKVEAWARESNFHLIKQGLVKGRRGPFKGRPPWQTVCVFTVRVPQGWNKSGWICFGNFFAWGFGKPEIHWDEEAGRLAV